MRRSYVGSESEEQEILLNEERLMEMSMRLVSEKD